MTRVLLVGSDTPLAAALNGAIANVTEVPDVAAALTALERSTFDAVAVAETPELAGTDLETQLLEHGHTVPVVDGTDRSPDTVVTATLERAETTSLATTRQRRQYARELEADLRAALASCETVSAIHRTACAEVVRSPLYRTAWLGEWDRDCELLVPAAAAGIELDTLTDQRADPTGPVAAQVPVEWAINTRTEADYATIATPVVGESPIGVLQVYTDSPDAVDQVEREFISSLGAIVGDALTQVADPGTAGATDGLAVLGETLAHELGNQLDAARVQLELARERDGGDHLGRVEAALERIGEVATEAKTLASGTVEPEPQPLTAAAEDAWTGVASDDITLSVTEGTVDADPALLRLLLENLFRNAVEHGPEQRHREPIPTGDPGTDGTGPDGPDPAAQDDTLTVRVGPLADGFFVADDGQGIPADRRDDVFEWGYTSGSSSGAGLGIVSIVADRHEWTVTLTESEGGGARFEFRR